MHFIVFLAVFTLCGLYKGCSRVVSCHRDNVCGERASIFSFSAWSMDAVVCVDNDPTSENVFSTLLCLIVDFLHYIWNKASYLLDAFNFVEEPEDPETLVETMGEWLGLQIFKKEKKSHGALQRFMCNNHDKILFVFIGLAFWVFFYAIHKYGIKIKEESPEPIAFVENFLTDAENESECCKTCSILTEKSENLKSSSVTS